MTDDTFDDIVAGFYRAASGGMSWVDALVPFQRSMSAIAVHLLAVNQSQRSIAFSHEASSMPAEASLDLIRTYHRIDPRASLVMGLRPGEWVHCWEHFDEDFVATDPFYQEFLIPYGGRYVSAVKLLQDESESVMLGVHRGYGSPKLDASEIMTCKRLARHLTEALIVNRENVNRRCQSRLGMDVLARLRAPIALLDEQRRIRDASPAALTLFASGGAVIESGGRLYCHRSHDDSAMLIGLRQLLGEDHAGTGCMPTDKLFLRACGPSGKTIGLYLYALHPQKTLHAFGEQPIVMMLFYEPGGHLELDPFVVAAAFDLTPGEARVAVATAHGTSPDEIASLHAVSIHTVRSQLSTIFSKTGTTRQAELVSLLAALPMAALGLADA